MSHKVNIPEIGAEMLLNYLYPELEDKWIVHNEGTFYRNYNNDILSVSPVEAKVRLARDGFLNLLPQGLISSEDELKVDDKTEKHKKIKQRKRILTDAFLPIDALTFRRRLKVEREISKMLNEKIDYILNRYFGFNLRTESNHYIKELAVLLPFIRRWRGDLRLLRKLLGSFFECKVNLLTGRYSETDSTRCWIPAVHYELLIDGLDPARYRLLDKELKPFAGFVREWFIPAETHFKILIKQHNSPAELNRSLTLDYNTEIIYNPAR